MAVPDYTGDGCPDLDIPSCLSCPLPLCRLDMPPKAAMTLLREASVRQMLEAGQTREQIAGAMGTSTRTVSRLKRGVTTARMQGGTHATD